MPLMAILWSKLFGSKYKIAILMLQINMSSTAVDPLIAKEIKQISGLDSLHWNASHSSWLMLTLDWTWKFIEPRTVSAGHKFTMRTDHDYAIHYCIMRSFCNTCMQTAFAHVCRSLMSSFAHVFQNQRKVGDGAEWILSDRLAVHSSDKGVHHAWPRSCTAQT